MTSLTDHLKRYLTTRRRFGYDLSFSERVLRRFTAFADAERAEFLTVSLFLRWKENYGAANHGTWSHRLGMVRGFAIWLHSSDSRHEVPPNGLIAGKVRRSRPYIYTDDEIAAIVTEAARLPSSYGLRGWTCSTLFGLVAATGLRISEAIGLDETDIDLDDRLLMVRRAKNGTSRTIPISSCCANRLSAYRTARNRILSPDQVPFFLTERGERPSDCSARYNFAQVCQRIGLRTKQDFTRHGRGPRIHDLRHTFAVHTIMDWYRRELHPDREMIKLSSYLGHTKPEYTYWYIEAVPELLELASQRADLSLKAGGRR